MLSISAPRASGTIGAGGARDGGGIGGDIGGWVVGNGGGTGALFIIGGGGGGGGAGAELGGTGAEFFCCNFEKNALECSNDKRPIAKISTYQRLNENCI